MGQLAGITVPLFGDRKELFAWPILLAALDRSGQAVAVPNQVDGSQGGIIIADTALHAGPFYALKAQGGDVVIASATVAAGWTGSLAGVTISNGDTLYMSGVSAVTLTSGTALAYLQ